MPRGYFLLDGAFIAYSLGCGLASTKCIPISFISVFIVIVILILIVVVVVLVIVIVIVAENQHAPGGLFIIFILPCLTTLMAED